MKKIILIGLLSFLFANVYAQTTSDSLAYQLQRKKINSMLAVRAQKFGKYDNSLNQHTGIFGLQTKKDIRRSNEILMDIVHTDNEIYKQLKILLDYRTFQQTQVLDQSKENEKAALSFMYSINKLKDRIEKLKKEAEETTKQKESSSRNYIIIIAILSVAILLLLRRQLQARTN